MKAIVLVLRGLHLGYLGCYGNEWILTPHLDRMAAGGVVFDQHYANCPDVSASRSIHRSGIVLPPAHSGADLISLLQSVRVNCSLVIDRLGPDASDFSKGWNFVCQVPVDRDCNESLDGIIQCIGSGLDDLAARSNGLLWIESDSLLPPWSIPDHQLEPYFQTPSPGEDDEEVEDEAEKLEPLFDPNAGPLPDPADQSLKRLQSTYTAAVSHAELVVGWLCDQLRELHLADESLLIVTTDHGQALGEHGIVGPYRPWLHDELIHIPLLMRLPRGEGAGRRIAALTQSVDLYPTLLEAFGVSPRANHGHSLLPLARAETECVRSFAVASLRLGEREEWAMRTNEWAYLLPIAAPIDDPIRGPRLYVKPDDRREVNNVLQHHLELGERLETVLKDYMAAPRRIGLETPWTADNGGQQT